MKYVVIPDDMVCFLPRQFPGGSIGLEPVQTVDTVPTQGEPGTPGITVVSSLVGGGSGILLGHGPPIDGPGGTGGTDGMEYLDLDTGDLYLKVGGFWNDPGGGGGTNNDPGTTNNPIPVEVNNIYTGQLAATDEHCVARELANGATPPITAKTFVLVVPTSATIRIRWSLEIDAYLIVWNSIQDALTGNVNTAFAFNDDFGGSDAEIPAQVYPAGTYYIQGTSYATNPNSAAYTLTIDQT